MEDILFSPPVVAVLFFFLLYGASELFSRYAHRGAVSEREADAYACGQRGVNASVSPNYSEFYPFAALFTILHVLVLTVASAPNDEILLPAAYILMVLGALIVIFRKVR